MSAPTIRQIIDEMADRIREATEDLGVPVQVEGYVIATPAHTPCIDIYPGFEPFFDTASAGMADEGDEGALVLTVRARIQATDSFANQDIMLELIDDQTDASIVNALLDDISIDETSSDVHVDFVSGYRPIPSWDGSQTYLGCVWRVNVIRGHS